jgi:uncharacterized protein YodC (DUF2158 family)
MTFKPGDRVRVKGQPLSEMAVKLVSDGYVLCEAWPGSGISVGAWQAEALEAVEHGLLIRRVSSAEDERD